MSEFNEYKTGHIATWLGQHDNTIRDWSRRYKKYLSVGANAGRRRYNDSDVRVLATVARYRNEGLAIDTIDTLLADGKLIPLEDIPKEPTPETEAARESVDIVAMPRDTYLLAVERYQNRIEDLEASLARSEGDRERIEAELKEVRSLYDTAKARLEVIEQERQPATFWLRVITVIVGIAVLLTIVAAFFLFSLSRA